ncbi:unnamed protein product [Durusdinium trenchii]|uniref:Peptidase M14 domain-containing protein n=1 Tax=Durusdinium trenchii TaxID=1381693 RepID=A0ABP0SF95_9DINO
MRAMDATLLVGVEGTRAWSCPQRRVIVGPMVFTSDFDSGNMGPVQLVTDAEQEDLLYTIDVAPDCAGTPHANGYRSWFFFGLSVAEPIEMASLEAKVPVEVPVERGEALEDEGDSKHVTCTSTCLEEGSRMKADAEGSKSTSSDSAAGNDAEEEEPAKPEMTKTELPQVNCEISVVLTIRNLNNHRKLFRDGYRPWCKMPGKPWSRLPDTPQLGFAIVEGEEMGIRWRHEASRGSGTVYYAFCAPYSYLDCQGLLEDLEDTFSSCPSFSWPDEGRGALRNLSKSINDDWWPKAGTDLLFRRQLLNRSLQGRRVDLLTVSKASGLKELEVWPPDLPCESPQVPKMAERPIVFISARVHPGETPGQFVFLGILRFLLSDDPRARSLRERFQFKLVPMLNPDGVACGHYRTNSLGLNLNRHYDKPSPHQHEGIWAAKRILSSWSKQGRLLFYLDLHGHASKRGCFLYANRMAGPGQGWNSGFARLCQMNSPHFELEQCEFGDEVDKEIEGREGEVLRSASSKPTGLDSGNRGKRGSGRVAIHRDCRLCNAYTLECNYNKGRATRPIVPPKGLLGADPPAAELFTEEPVPYAQGVWAQVGEACVVSILDLFGHNCHSRMLNSRGSLHSLLGSTIRPRTGRMTHVKDVLPQGVGLTPEDIAARERPCWRSACGWATATSSAPAAPPRGASREAAAPVPRAWSAQTSELRICGARAVPRADVAKEEVAPRPGSVLRRRRTLSSDPRKAHRGESAKVRPPEVKLTALAH